MVAGLNKTFPSCGEGVIPCYGTDANGIDNTIGAVILTEVEISTSSTVNPTGYSTTFLGLFYELVLSTGGHIIFGKDFPLLKRIQTAQNNS